MQQNTSFRQLVVVTALLSAFLALICTILITMLPMDMEAALSANPVLIGSREADIAYWSMILDMFGYYILVAPAALYLYYWLKPKNPALATLFTMSGFAYILIGAIGAAILAATLPPLFNEVGQAVGERRESLSLVIQTTYNMVFGGMWNLLEVGLAAAWWIGIGVMLRQENRLFAIMTIILGLVTALDAAGNIARSEDIASIGLYVYLVLAVVWQAWAGVLAWQGSGAERETPSYSGARVSHAAR